MAYLEGLLSGFAGRKAEVEAQNLAEAQRSQQREEAVLSALVNSPDPDIQGLAVAGLLHSAQPAQRKSGLRGWLGEMESSPFLPRIMDLINQPRQVTEESVQTSLPSTQTSGFLSTLPGQTPAALPGTSSVNVGAPPPTPVESHVAATPSAPVTSVTSRSMLRPRQVFLSPEEQYLQQKRGAARGDVEGEIAGLVASGTPQAEAADIVKRKMLGRSLTGAGQSYAEGNVIADPESPTGYSQELYLRADPRVKQRIPAQAPLTPEEMARRARATTIARGGAAAAVPLSTQQRFQATERLATDWTKLQAPLREMQRQHLLMQTGLRRFSEGDKIGGAQAVLVTFQKILDPISVVRESEYARSGAGLSLMNRIEGFVQRLSEGGAGVPPEEMAEMVETANQFLQGMEGWNDAQRQRIHKEATDYGIDPQHIFGAGGVGAPPPTPGAAPGGPSSPGAPPPGAGGGGGVAAAPTAVGAPPPAFTPAAIRPVTSRTAPAGAPPAGATQTGPGGDWTMVNGVLHYKGKPY